MASSFEHHLSHHQRTDLRRIEKVNYWPIELRKMYYEQDSLHFLWYHVTWHQDHQILCDHSHEGIIEQ